MSNNMTELLDVYENVSFVCLRPAFETYGYCFEGK